MREEALVDIAGVPGGVGNQISAVSTLLKMGHDITILQSQSREFFLNIKMLKYVHIERGKSHSFLEMKYFVSTFNIRNI